MANKKYRLNDPFLNEFIFHCIITAPHDIKNRLPLELLRHTTTNEKAKAFAERSGMERKMELYTRLGGAVTITFHPPGYLSKKKLDEIHADYEKNDSHGEDSANEMINANVFVVTDREQQAIHALMGMNCHSETYMLNRDYSLIAAQIAQNKLINKKLNDAEYVKSAMEDYKIVMKFMMYNLLNQEHVNSMSAYNLRELLILMYLFLNKNRYVPIGSIEEFFRNKYAAPVLNRTIYNLCDSFHVTKWPRSYRYTISGIGIQVLASYVSRIINHTISY